MIINAESKKAVLDQLPALNCGLCGYRSCEEFADLLVQNPAESKRCVHLKEKQFSIASVAKPALVTAAPTAGGCGKGCVSCEMGDAVEGITWRDSLDREFDFILDTFPNEPGPRETMRLHNPQLTKELDVKRGDIIIGRPLGMSCGCPITHCGVVMNVEPRTGVIVWCVTGPLNPRAGAHKDIGYYSAEAYEGLVRDTQKELKIGMRYWFMPRRCMLQWRHSGLINFISRTKDGVQIRIEGLLIG
jgi:uncharacterized Fe-S cluster-containing protein